MHARSGAGETAEVSAVLEELISAAAAAYGDARVREAAMRAALELAAGAVARLMREPLELLEAEPERGSPLHG